MPRFRVERKQRWDPRLEEIIPPEYLPIVVGELERELQEQEEAQQRQAQQQEQEGQ